MPRARIALLGAGACLVLLVATWYAAFHVGLFERADRSILRGFAGLTGPGSTPSRASSLTSAAPSRTCSWPPYRWSSRCFAVGPGGDHGRADHLAANVTTQLLKALVATPRHFELPGFVLDSSRGRAATRPRRWHSRCAR